MLWYLDRCSLKNQCLQSFLGLSFNSDPIRQLASRVESLFVLKIIVFLFSHLKYVPFCLCFWQHLVASVLRKNTKWKTIHVLILCFHTWNTHQFCVCFDRSYTLWSFGGTKKIKQFIEFTKCNFLCFHLKYSPFRYYFDNIQCLFFSR